MQNNVLKQKMASGRPALGLFCKMSDPTVYELAALAGFDFAIIDMEHGPPGFETAQQLIRTCETRGIGAVIRIPANRAEYVQRALDIGAHAVQVPEVNSAADARSLVGAARFSPQGQRGVCRFVRAAQYTGLQKSAYFEAANSDQQVIAHIEGRAGLENLDAILEVAGVDVIFIGPYDLSQSLGVPGNTGHELVQEAMADIVRRSRAAGKKVGTFVESAQEAAFWMKQGVGYIAYSVDVGMILQSFTGVVQAVRSGWREPGKDGKVTGKKQHG